jgi:hypothetical protein
MGEFLQATAIIDSTHPLIVAQAAEIAGGAADCRGKNAWTASSRYAGSRLMAISTRRKPYNFFRSVITSPVRCADTPKLLSSNS